MRRSVGLLLLAGLSTQFGAAYATTLFDRVGASGTVFLRLLFAAAVLVVVWRPRLAGRSPRELRLALGLGAALGAMNFAYYHAISHIPIGAAVTIEFLGPLTVAVAGSRRTRDFAWIGLALLGVVLLSNPLGASSSLNAPGVAFALVAGVAWGSYILLTARVGRDWAGATGLSFGMVVGALLVAPAGIAQGGTDLLAPSLLAAGVLVALASSVIPYSLEMFALRKVPEHVFGVLMSLEPAIGCLAGFVVLGQGLSATDLLAVAFVVVASAGATLGAPEPEPVAVASAP